MESGIDGLRIGVVGAGVGGTAAAAILARCGHQVELLEQAPTLGPVGAGLLVQPTGMKVLELLGLAGEIKRRSEPVERLVARRASGGPLLDLALGSVQRGTVAHGVHRGDLHEVLVEHARSHGVRISLGREIVASDGAAVTTAAGERYGDYDVVVVANGSASRLRQALEVTHTEREYAHGAFWTVGNAPTVRNRLAQVVDGTRELVGMLPLGEGRCNLLVGFRLGDLPAIQARGIEVWRERVARLMPESEPILAGIGSFADLTIGRYRRASLRTPAAGRVVLIGDAAHPMSPHLGQGANLALLDAWELGCALTSCGSVDDAWCRYADRRRAHVRMYAMLARVFSPFFQHDGRMHGHVRDLAVPLLTRLPGGRRVMAQTATGSLGGLTRWTVRISDPPEAFC